MAYQVRHIGQVLNRQTISNEVWGYDVNPSTKIFDVQACSLRKVLEVLDAPFEIKTHRGLEPGLQMKNIRDRRGQLKDD